MRAFDGNTACLNDKPAGTRARWRGDRQSAGFKNAALDGVVTYLEDGVEPL